MKIALVETKQSRSNFEAFFDKEFEFDQYQLCSNPNIKKVLKRDCDIDIEIDLYDWIILVGSDALKYFTKEGSVTTFSGKSIGKYLPIINPAMLAFKPEAKGLWESSKKNIIAYIKGEVEEATIDGVVQGIQDTETCNTYIQKAIEYPLEHVAIDCETTGLYPRNGFLQGISISYDCETGAYISSECFDEKTEKLLQELINKKIVIFHNAKFDLSFLEYHLNLVFPRFEDTMLLHYIIDETVGTHGLKELVLRYTKYGDYEKPLRDWIDNYCREYGILKADFCWDVIPFDTMYPYASIDALGTFLIYEKFKQVKQNKKLLSVYDNILIPACRFIKDMQDNGVPFNITRLKTSQQLMQNDIDEAIAKLYENEKIAEFEKIQGKEFNPNSVLQLRVLLFDFLGLQPTGKKTAKGANSTDKEVLDALATQSDIPKLIIDIREKSKIKNTYLDKIIPQLDRDQRLRTNFNLHVASSGRLSSSGKLNMQQLPRDNPIIKGCIQAALGFKIVAMDLQTAEVYTAAVLSGDKALMNVFKSGGDFHSNISKLVFKLSCPAEEVKDLYPLYRQAAKAVSFGIMFGAGADKISEEVTKSSGQYFSVKEAEQVIYDYFKAFHKLKAWINSNKDFIQDNGFLYSFFGRKRRLPNVRSNDKGIKGHAIRSGINFLMQSSASDVNLLGAIDMHSYILDNKMGARIFALVHDSILAEVPDNEVDLYISKLTELVQLDRGISIPGSPIGCDFSIGQDYAFGKYEEKYGEIK